MTTKTCEFFNSDLAMGLSFHGNGTTISIHVSEYHFPENFINFNFCHECLEPDEYTCMQIEGSLYALHVCQ